MMKRVANIVLLLSFIFSFPGAAMEGEESIDGQQHIAKTLNRDEELEGVIPSQYVRILHDLYEKEAQLQATKTYRCLSVAHAATSIFSSSEDLLYRAAYVGLPFIKEYVTPYLPQRVQPFFRMALDELSYQLEILRFCEYTKRYIAEKVLGYTSLLLMNTLSSEERSYPHKEELEAAVYYFAKAAGWYQVDVMEAHLHSAWESADFSGKQSSGLLFVAAAYPVEESHENLQCSTALMNPLSSDQFVYDSPELTANAKAISDLTNCFWHANGTKIIEPDWDCPKNTIESMPDYGNLKIWEEWYDDVQYFPGGRSKYLLTAVTKQARDGIPANTKIIIIARDLGSYYWAQDLLNYCQKLSILHDYNGKAIVDYYPKVFGAYLGDFFSVEMIPPSDFRIPVYIERSAKKMRMSYLEMEYLEDIGERNAYEDAYPDNIVFEREFADWTSIYIAKCKQGDISGGWRHDLLVNVPYYRAYHIGSEAYLFNPGVMPKMIDIDTLSCGELFGSYGRAHFRPEKVQSQEAKSLVSEFAEKGIFDVFSLYFSKYKISKQNPLPLDGVVKHYYLPDEYLGKK